MPNAAETEQSSSLKSLAGAFELFNRRSAEIEQAYQALKERVAQVDAQLEEANEQLRAKVTELDHVQGHLRNILHSMTDGVVAVDIDGIITMFSNSAGDILGIDPKEAIGLDCRELLRNGDDSPLMLIETLNSGRPFRECRHELTSNLGDARPVVETTTSLIIDANGDVQGAVEVFRDRTEIEELEQRLFRSDRLAQVGEMAAGLAHEIRNPLGGIEGFAALLQRKLDKDIPEADANRLRRLVGNITTGVQSLNSTVSGMLDFCRDDTFRPKCVRLSDMFQGLLSTAEMAPDRHDAADIDIVTDFEIDEIDADPGLLRQAFLNLIKNAIESMEDGGRLCVKSRPAVDDTLQIDIIDSGPGIQPALLPRLFDPFVTGREGGTGLGLAIVNKIIRRHGGKIDVSSVTAKDDPENHGTTFSVILPLRRAEAKSMHNNGGQGRGEKDTASTRTCGAGETNYRS